MPSLVDKGLTAIEKSKGDDVYKSYVSYGSESESFHNARVVYLSCPRGLGT